MKKVLLVMSLCLPLVALVASDITPVPVAEDYELGPPSTSLPDEWFELIYDESSMVEFGFKMKEGDRMAVQFTPGDFGENMYPFTVDSACYVPIGWGDDPDNWDAPCNLVFFQGGEPPGPEIARKEVSASQQAAYNWFYVGDLGIEIPSGNFYFAVENKVDDNPGLMLDGGPPVHEVSWMYTVFQGETDPKWAPFTNINVGFPDDMTLGDSVDLVLRIKGTAPGASGVVELTPDVAPPVSVPTLVASNGTIKYSLVESGEVEVTLWDALGRCVNTVHQAYEDAGEHSLSWDASTLPAGTYFIKLTTRNSTNTSQVVILN